MPVKISAETWHPVLKILTDRLAHGPYKLGGQAPVAVASARTKSRMFPASPEYASQARRYLAEVLGDRASADDAVLCLSELFSNSLLHSRSRESNGTITVRVRESGERIRVEVDDQGGAWRICPEDDDEHGRGLGIVKDLVAAWGTEDTATGRTVWFEMICPRQSEPDIVPSRA